ncbi:unnamed protein product, partial [Urochloa humidicola]
IITTRNRDVANTKEVYELRALTPDHSEKLFKTRLFGVNAEYPAHHPAEASEKILKKCGGVPLAIITIASLLVGKSREDWLDVCNSPGFYGGNKGNQQVDDTEWILSLSYYDLPSYLRTCLLYLSVYREDYEIEKELLIWKWVAEGFVKKRGTNLFEHGEEYFNQLVNRSMIQAVESERTGIVYGCRVHDMVLDLIRELSHKENFVTISSNDDEGTSPQQKRVRRLAHHNRIMKQTQQDDHMDRAQAHLRSLVAYRCDTESWVLHPSFKLLRVLHLEGCSVPREGWLDLLHLRYLGLRQTYGIRELPEEIGKLKFLQILDLESSGVEVLPSSICQLTQLVRLHGDRLTCAPPNGSFLRKLTSLEDLRTRIDNLNEESQRQFMKDLGKLSHVRVLHIVDCLCKAAMVQSDLVNSLGNLHKLQHLQLQLHGSYGGPTTTTEWDRVVLSQHLRYLALNSVVFHRVPSCISAEHLPILRSLTLRVDHMDGSSLRVLGGLPELSELCLLMVWSSVACTATVANITAGDGFFKKLRHFRLYRWMVQLVPNKDSTGVSFSIWNGMGGTALVGSKTKDDEYSRSAAPLPVTMANLQDLQFEVPVRALYEGGNGRCGDLVRLECLPSLRKVVVCIKCEGASVEDVEKAEAELRSAAQLHPNRPVIAILPIR